MYSYTWDAENHLKSANGVNYTYDGDLRRVEKSNGKLYWYSTGGQILEETDLSGNLINDYVYFAGKRNLATRCVRECLLLLHRPAGHGAGAFTPPAPASATISDFYPFGGE
ncbi:MAG TPA: hypothetical protein VG204_11245 [Terriglobia bacterium]|nr:hypothetical protein [Terriglobia bacterium]